MVSIRNRKSQSKLENTLLFIFLSFYIINLPTIIVIFRWCWWVHYETVCNIKIVQFIDLGCQKILLPYIFLIHYRRQVYYWKMTENIWLCRSKATLQQVIRDFYYFTYLPKTNPGHHLCFLSVQEVLLMILTGHQLLSFYFLFHVFQMSSLLFHGNFYINTWLLEFWNKYALSSVYYQIYTTKTTKRFGFKNEELGHSYSAWNFRIT